jgi:hypothetical protein
MKNILYLCALNFNSNMRTILDNQKEKIALIQQVLPESLTYEVYRKKILADLQLVSNEELNTPGSLPHYAHLNHARMNRLDKTIALDDHSIKILNNLKIKYVWILITEGWCGDAAQIAPVISKLADFSDHIDLKIVLRDQHLDLMDQFLTNGARAIPKLIILNESQIDIIATWGARPSEAQKLISDYKVEHGVIDNHIKTELQKWYLKDKGLSTMHEILDLVR